MISRRNFFRCIVGGVAVIYVGIPKVTFRSGTRRITATEVIASQRRFERMASDAHSEYMRAVGKAMAEQMDRVIIDSLYGAK